MSDAVRLAAMRPEHADRVLEIYRLGIATGHATFETTAPTWPEFDASRLPDHRLVAVDRAGEVVGWAAVTPVSDRCAYAGVVEHSVYVHPDARGRGVGRALLTALLASTDAAASGPSSPGSSPRTPPAWPSTTAPASAPSASANASAATTGPGAT